MVKFVQIRASSGNDADTWFDSYWAGAKSVGSGSDRLILGVTHTFESDTDPVVQAKFFHEQVTKGGTYDGDLPPAVDVEHNPGKLDKETFANQLKIMMETCSSLFGQRCSIYTGYGVWSRLVAENNWAQDYPLWVAMWIDRNPADYPTLPREWANNGKTAYMWQYIVRADGRDFGVSSERLDHDRYWVD
jgi:GH25 family lysozyme M1 (1,4-beta-N-acetylmuramidase)